MWVAVLADFVTGSVDVIVGVAVVMLQKVPLKFGAHVHPQF